jgi:hypothetical protein
MAEKYLGLFYFAAMLDSDLPIQEKVVQSREKGELLSLAKRRASDSSMCARNHEEREEKRQKTIEKVNCNSALLQTTNLRGNKLHSLYNRHIEAIPELVAYNNAVLGRRVFRLWQMPIKMEKWLKYLSDWLTISFGSILHP